jgi:hypothetical protein
MQENVNVDGLYWHVPTVTRLYPTEAEFVSTHINDMGTYPHIKDAERRERTLKLAYKAVQDNTPKEVKPQEPEKPTKGKPTTTVESPVNPETEPGAE